MKLGTTQNLWDAKRAKRLVCIACLFGSTALVSPSMLWAQDAPKPAEETPPAPDTTKEATAAAEEEPPDEDQEDEVEGVGDPGKAVEEAKKEEAENAPAPAMAPSLMEDATPEERAAIEAYQSAFSRYSAESEDYQSTVDAIVQSKYRQKVAEIQQVYTGQIDQLTATERGSRVETIAAFEQFIARYPQNEKYTPDAMFRLADLYFEKANDDYLMADEAYQKKIEEYEAGKVPDLPEEPERDYSPTVDIFQRLVTEWPDYRLNDGAYYLLGYTKVQMGEEEEAKELFLTLIEKHPESKFVPEAWIRIGEHFFDQNDLERASASYAKAAEFPESRFYDKALYKLAWTNYRQDKFVEAITLFKNLIEYSDRREQETGTSGSVLRAEAIQYVAISLSENDWNADAIADQEFGMPRVRQFISGEKAYEYEVLTALTEMMMKAEYQPEAADVVRFTLSKYPMHKDNPKLHEQLVLALYRQGKLDETFATRREMGVIYGPESEWFEHQRKEGNAEAMRYATRLVRDNLIQSATWFHEQAQQERGAAIARQDEALLASAREKYALAAKTYAEFLKKHPNDKDVFRWNFYYAETLFYAQQYQPAYEQYRVVRELDIRDKDFDEIQETSGLNAIKALEELVRADIRQGKLPSNLVADAEAAETSQEVADPEAEAETIVAKPLPELVRKYVTSMDRYVVLGLKNPEDPYADAKFAFSAAKVFYDYDDFPEARRRFDWIIKNYSSNEVAGFAAALNIETYRRQKDYDTLAKKANEYKDMLSGETGELIRTEIAEFELAALFKAAEQAYGEKRYEEAAQKYLELVSRDKEKKYVVKSLLNAAVSYESLGKYDSAMDLYERIYTEYPKDPYATYALYRVAVNAERFFEFRKAISNYLAFYDRFGQKETPKELAPLGFTYREKGADALRNAAVLMESTGDTDGAADRYVMYAENYADRPDADDAYWEAIESWKKGNQKSKMVQGYERYIERYGSSENNARVFEALGALADHYEERGSKSTADKWYNTILNQYATRGIQPGTPEAMYAAKATFMLTEREFDKWDAIKFTGSAKNQGEQLKKKVAGQKDLTPKYQNVFAYKNLEWTMAASYRLGNMYQRFAQALYAAPVPFKEGSEEWDLYRGELDDLAVPLEDEAVKSYAKVVEKAREEKIVNEWTKKAVEQLNVYRPADYPLYKEERQSTTDAGFTALPYLDSTAYKGLEGSATKEDK